MNLMPIQVEVEVPCGTALLPLPTQPSPPVARNTSHERPRAHPSTRWVVASQTALCSWGPKRSQPRTAGIACNRLSHGSCTVHAGGDAGDKNVHETVVLAAQRDRIYYADDAYMALLACTTASWNKARQGESLSILNTNSAAVQGLGWTPFGIT